MPFSNQLAIDGTGTAEEEAGAEREGGRGRGREGATAMQGERTSGRCSILPVCRSSSAMSVAVEYIFRHGFSFSLSREGCRMQMSGARRGG